MKMGKFTQSERLNLARLAVFVLILCGTTAACSRETSNVPTRAVRSSVQDYSASQLAQCQALETRKDEAMLSKAEILCFRPDLAAQFDRRDRSLAKVKESHPDQADEIFAFAQKRALEVFDYCVRIGRFPADCHDERLQAEIDILSRYL